VRVSDLLHLTQDMVRWQALSNTVVNFEAVMAVKMSMLLLVVTPCGFVGRYQRNLLSVSWAEYGDIMLNLYSVTTENNIHSAVDTREQRRYGSKYSASLKAGKLLLSF
jgi:hypothetical protein